MMDELKPCPFCGSDEVVLIRQKLNVLSNIFGVGCTVCCMGTFQFFNTQKEAVEAWNRRVGDQE